MQNRRVYCNHYPCLILIYVINGFFFGIVFRDVSTSRAPVVDTTSIKAKPGQGCPRCGGVVFAAEQVLAKGSVSKISLYYSYKKKYIFMMNQ